MSDNNLVAWLAIITCTMSLLTCGNPDFMDSIQCRVFEPHCMWTYEQEINNADK